MANMKRMLQSSSIGYNASYKLGGRVADHCLYSLMYADDITLLADSEQCSQALINTRGDGDAFGFAFSANHSVRMTFNDSTDQMLRIQGQEVPTLEEHKYLGAWVNEGKCARKSANCQLWRKGEEMPRYSNIENYGV